MGPQSRQVSGLNAGLQLPVLLRRSRNSVRTSRARLKLKNSVGVEAEVRDNVAGTPEHAEKQRYRLFDSVKTEIQRL